MKTVVAQQMFFRREKDAAEMQIQPSGDYRLRF